MLRCNSIWATIFALLLSLSAAAFGQAVPSTQQQVEAVLRQAPTGTRFGIVVVDNSGRDIVSIAPTDRFIPASNTKMFTTAAAFALLADLEKPDIEGGTQVYLKGKHRPDVILVGRGDARLSSAPDCLVDCLATLADATAATTRHVRHVVGDATWFPDQRWSAGMSWNNIAERSGTAVAALSLDSNQLPLRVTPGAVDQPPLAEVSPYVTIDNRAITIPSGATTLDVERLPLENTVRLTGVIAVSAPATILYLGIDDPAHYTAWTFARMLQARKVRVSGNIQSRYSPPLPAALSSHETPPVAQLTPLPLADDLITINKVSQNLHAELLIRRIARQYGNGSVKAGVAAVAAMLERAGVPRTAFDFSDGSGMSTYNRVAPRGVVVFLRWIAAQPWGAAWRATLPIGGVDGTIRRRFTGTPLERRIFAKTGGLNATSALSGYMIARSGRELTFSILANDIPDGASVLSTIDAALMVVAAAN